MYHCYLRGKQFELLAIRYTINKIVTSNSVPVIEPVRESSRDLLSCIKVLHDNHANYIVIVNPKVGELANNSLAREGLIDQVSGVYPDTELGVILDNTSTQTEISTILSRYKHHRFSFIHFGQFQNIALLQELSEGELFNKHIFIEHSSSSSYQEQFNAFKRVIIDDSFNRKATNREYSNQLEEFFTDLHVSHKNRGFQGYGDFSIVGDYFSEGGGQAITAAIHVAFSQSYNEIYIRHFLSDERVIADEVPILLEEAISKLKSFLDTKPEILNWSQALKEMLQIYQDGCQTNLAYIKKLSIAHHFELMSYISKNS